MFCVDDRGFWWRGIFFLGEEAHVLAGYLVYVCLQWRVLEGENEGMDGVDDLLGLNFFFGPWCANSIAGLEGDAHMHDSVSLLAR